MPTTQPLSSLPIQFGPLRYLLHAHDEWAQRLLASMQKYLDARPFDGEPGRVIHLLAHRANDEDYARIAESRLPRDLTSRTATPPPEAGWWSCSDDLGYAYYGHRDSMDCYWTYDARWSKMPSACQIPWAFFAPDLAQHCGGLVHGGLAVYQNRGIVLTAPPDGGKSTALSRLPAPWVTLSDDAALMWFDQRSRLWASPLPTWSVLLGRGSLLPADHRPAVATAVPVERVALLVKSSRERATRIEPIEAVPPLYRALREHPAAPRCRADSRAATFHCASEMARAVPVYELELTVDGPFWGAVEGIM